MEASWKDILWRQFGASIDMLENAIVACPDTLWSDPTRKPEFWYTAFHALFFLDLYLSEREKGFKPPAPFTLDEMDERGLMPDRVYSKAELLKYLVHGRAKCRATLAALTDGMLEQRCGFSWLDITVAETHLYNMRHVQHHAGQLNMMISHAAGSAPRWVRKTAAPLSTPAAIPE